MKACEHCGATMTRVDPEEGINSTSPRYICPEALRGLMFDMRVHDVEVYAQTGHKLMELGVIE